MYDLDNDLVLPMAMTANQKLDSADAGSATVEHTFLSIEKVQHPTDMDEDASMRTNTFGHAWLDESVEAATDQV